MVCRLASVFLILLIIITNTNGLSVDINPIPAAVIAGDNLIVTSIITKKETETWKSLLFYVVDGEKNSVCRGAPNIAPADCKDIFSCTYGFGFTCNYTHFNLQLNNVQLSMLGFSIYAEVTITGSPKVKSVSTTIQVKIPLQGVSLTPNGTLTKNESDTQVFRCFAKSLPIASLSWYLSGSLLPTQSPPDTTTDTVTSTYTYTAQKEDYGKRLMCTAVYEATSFTKDALLNVLYRPIVHVSPNDNPFRVIENETNLQFTCIVNATNPEVTSFIWKKDGYMTSVVNSNYIIQTVNRSHKGIYTCGATNSIGTSDPFAAIQLEVLYGITINNVTKKKPTEGTRLRITCSGQSNPAVSYNDVTWTKQGNITFNRKGKQLEIENVNIVDSGNYVCSVVIELKPSSGLPRNVTGKTTVEVDVLYRPTVGIYPNYTQFKVIENTSKLTLECKVVGSNPGVLSFKWYRNGSPIDGSTDASYTIPSVQRSHTGRYTCAAKNSVGSSDMSSIFQLNVLYGLDINPIKKVEQRESTQLSVFCNVTSYPELTNNDVNWTKQDNSTFSKTGLHLVINNLNRIDSGKFVCSVVLELIPTVGKKVTVTGTNTVEVDILYKPTVTVSPDYNQYNVIENTTNLQLTCTVTDANPAVTSYRWYKGNSLMSNTMATYTIPTVLRAHAGSYKCDATNIVGASIPSSTLELNILYGVELNSISKEIQNEGKKLNITCNGQSYPMMTSSDVKWSKLNNNTFRREGFQLVIDNVNRLDSGTYICSVVLQLIPTVGQPENVTGTTTVVIDVLYRPDVTVLPDINQYSVKENSTDLNLTCRVTDAFPALSTYRWYKDGVIVSTAAEYVLSTVYRSQTGSYTCDATNSVGTSDISSGLRLDVLFGVSLKLSDTEISIDESQRWELSCIGNGNPVPNITCMYGYNMTKVGEQKNNVTSIMIDYANCVDTGLYMCFGNNTIGQPVSQSAEINVACKPRTYNNVKEKDIFINGTEESLNISATFISFPLSNITWSRELPGGNSTDLDNEFKFKTIPSKLPYETISSLQKDQLTQDEFGIYLVNASNIHGSFLVRYHVIPKRTPDAPTNITAHCSVTSIKVTWISRFNGGENQTFRMNFVNTKLNKTISIGNIADKGENEIINEENEPLSPNTLYLVSLEAENVFGTTKGSYIVNCTTKTNQEKDQPISAGLVGGITGSISALLIVIFVIGSLYWWRWRQVPGGDKELINRCSKEKEEDEEGLKANPLYVTAEEASNVDVVPMYGVVNKQKKNKENIVLDDIIDQGPIYSQVQKSNTQEKKQKEKKERKRQKNDSSKGIELGTVYENSDKLLTHKSHDELYANAGEQGHGLNSTKNFAPQKNKDGLIYADLDLIPGPSGKKFVIRGLENRTNYAIIDLSKKAEPLPPDSEDEDNDNGNVKSHDNDGNEQKS